MTVTIWGLQICLWQLKGTVAYCSDGLNGNWNLDTDCRSVTSHIVLTPAELSISHSTLYTKCTLTLEQELRILDISLSIFRECNAQLGTICRGGIFISIIKAYSISTRLQKICIQAELKYFSKHVGSFSQLSVSIQLVQIMSFGHFAQKIFKLLLHFLP